MKYLLLIPLFFSACTASNKTTQSWPTNTEQIYLDTPSNETPQGLPGKCYTNMRLNREFRWVETICPMDINKALIKQLQLDLQRRGYNIAQTENNQVTFGDTTKAALKSFQIENKMAHGGLDWATVNKLKL